MLYECFAWALFGNCWRGSKNAFKVAVFLYELARSLVTYAFDARNIVRSISYQGEIVCDVLWCYAETVRPILCRYPLFFNASWTTSPWIQQPYTWSNKLLEILVSGHNNSIYTFFFGLP